MLCNSHNVKMPLPPQEEGGQSNPKNSLRIGFYTPKNPWSQHSITISLMSESGTHPPSSKIESDLCPLFTYKYVYFSKDETMKIKQERSTIPFDKTLKISSTISPCSFFYKINQRLWKPIYVGQVLIKPDIPRVPRTNLV